MTAAATPASGEAVIDVGGVNWLPLFLLHLAILKRLTIVGRRAGGPKSSTREANKQTEKTLFTWIHFPLHVLSSRSHFRSDTGNLATESRNGEKAIMI
jgi:hypothetical protein